MTIGKSARRGAGLVALAGLLALGLALLLRMPLERGPASHVSASAVVAPPPGQDASDATPDATPGPPADDAPPSLDVVRIDTGGSTVVAGRGAAGAEVILRVDGEEVARATADAAGKFVSLFSLDAAQTPRLLTIETRDGSGRVARAADSIIVAPVAAATEDLAEAPPEETAPASGSTTEEVAAMQADPADSIEAPPVEDRPADPAEVRAAVDPTRPATSSPTAPPPRLFRTGPDGVSVVSTPSSPADGPSSLGIDAIAYDEDGAVQLAGRGARDGDLRISLDGRPVQRARVGPGGDWTAPLPGVARGVYTLRIDALGPDGTVIDRIETPFERTAPDLAAAAGRAGATAITVQPGFTLWAISEGHFGEGVQYVQIFEANRDLIRDPDLIFPGQVFALPGPAD